MHLFADHLLIATRWTDRHRPADYYVVAGITYDVISFRTNTEQDGDDGFTVQVTARP